MASALTFTSGRRGILDHAAQQKRRPTWTPATPSGTLLVETVAGAYAIKWQMAGSPRDLGRLHHLVEHLHRRHVGENQTDALTPGAPPPRAGSADHRLPLSLVFLWSLQRDRAFDRRRSRRAEAQVKANAPAGSPWSSAVHRAAPQIGPRIG